MNKFLFILVLIAHIGLLHAQYTAIPDPAFEQELIDQGIDTEDILDGQVLTTDIEPITMLFLITEIYSLEGIEGFTNLEELHMSESLIYLLDLTQNTTLRILSCSTNMLNELDLSQNINLESLNCSDGFISELDLTNIPNLTFISCGDNNISILDLSDKPYLISLDCSGNPLTNLDISNTPNLTYLATNGTELTTLNVSGNPLLEYLAFSNNFINTLNLEDNQNLKYLFCNNNSIQELNVNNNPLLERLRCENNDLNTLNIQNGANELLTGSYMSGNNEVQRFNSLNNPNLTCIFVDDAQYCSDNWVDYDPTSNFVETQTECDAIGIDNYSLTNTVILYPNPVFDSLYIEGNQTIEHLNVYSITGKLIKTFRNQEKYQVSELMDGVYIIKIHFKDKIIQQKLIKR